jgi:hypothetical protein
LLLECLRLREAVQRDSGDAAHAEQSLQQAAEEAAKSYGESSPEVAGVLEEIATGTRAQGRLSLPILFLGLFSYISGAGGPGD